ncbi:membrane protein [Flavobacterium noncentrifugens]|uniref:SusD family protein n=1 Tax=Flavobacterium noncentrifugens TaxID=1128970 RepID=A0A1G8Y0U3_9FLAO|nr:RagB/SusD family nutrient uptake outer membrane protein [Flavobacterium noncentrifugens]GEP52268.1 membrane protein [Flavobacterium noncentrifugens]SDJ96469.1 SusD family protein [Flavobacterium noncentrifugens]
MKNIFFTTCFLLLCLSGCDSFTEVELPNSQLTSDAVFEDKATADAAMADIYTKIRDNGLLTGNSWGISNQLGLYGDELDFYGNPLDGSLAFYNNALLASSTEVADMWNNSYNQIYAANAVIEGVAKSASLAQADKDRLTGEVLFVRALVHFYLLQCFGDIPYVTTTDYNVNRSVSRQPESIVYGLLMADLEQAVSFLPEDYNGANRVRPNKWAATALLSRVYLYEGLWAEASNAASAVLNQTGLYGVETDLDRTFVIASKSTIWQLMANSAGGNTYEAQTFIFFSGPPTVSALTPNLMAAFEPGDQRKAHWTKEVTGENGEAFYHAYKYKEDSSTGSSKEYSVVLRIGELYLIRAEARAQQGELIDAKEDLDIIRSAAGLSPTTAVTQTDILNAILAERRVELFTEYGHRFFDLKRADKLDAVLPLTKPGWDSSDRLFPIPATEILRNRNLAPQNAGY